MEGGGSGGGEAAPCSAEMTTSLPSKLKIAGFWAGALDVDLETWTLTTLRQEIGRRSNCPADAIKMICGGKVLTNEQGGKTLIELGIKKNAKILATRVKLEEVKAFNDAKLAEEERTRRLARIREAVSSLAEKQTNESLAGEDFAFEVESLSGQKVELGNDSDRRAIMMGLMLHSNGKHLIKQAKYKEALDVLTMGEEAFSLCDPKVVEMMDNGSILQIDMVWCYFMLRDISCLSVAGVRLDKVRKSIDPKKFDHTNLTLEDQHLQRITYLRLELLEGVVAYHCGRFEESRKALASAQAKYLQFQVSDEGLTKLMNLGYQRRTAKRALIICGQDIENAANFLIEERTKKARRMEADRRRIQDTREQKSYGLTPNGKLVNMEHLTVLTSFGIQKRIAAEALRRTENDVQRALDDATNHDTHCNIQLSIVTRDRTIEELVSMGFGRSQVVTALNQTGSKNDALAILVSEKSDDPQTPRTARARASSSRRSESDASAADKQTEGMVAEAELENEITRGVSADPLSELDVDVTREGEAISEYMALLDSIERDGSSCRKD